MASKVIKRKYDMRMETALQEREWTIQHNKKLKRDIEELKSEIAVLKEKLKTKRWKLNTCTNFSPQKMTRFGKVQDADLRIKNELYKLGGLYCSKFTKEECIFMFSTNNVPQKENVFTVQIVIENEEANLGKCFMPMSFKATELLSETPLGKPKNIQPFIRNCKHHVECYFLRMQQFQAMKDFVSGMKNCILGSNLGYTFVTLELHNVYHKKDDIKMNIVIVLAYNSNNVRPYKIDVDINTTKKCNDKLKQHLKASFSPFKSNDLKTAFDKILMEDNSLFAWERNIINHSTKFLKETSSSEEEGFLTDVLNITKRKLSRKRNKHVKTVLKKKKLNITTSKRKQQDNVTKSPPQKLRESKNHSSSEISSEIYQKLSPNLAKKAEIKNIPTTQKTSEISAYAVTTPSKRVRLKQTKLHFQRQSIDLDKSGTSPIHNNLQNNPVVTKRRIHLLTSTPLHKTVINSSASSFNISFSSESNNKTPNKSAKEDLNDKQARKKRKK